MTRYMHAFDVEVAVEDGKILGAGLGDMERDDKVFDSDACRWLSMFDDSNDPKESALWDQDQDAIRYLLQLFAFPQQVIEIFRLHTGPDGWDINIMDDIAGLLVANGWVSETDPIINAESYPDENAVDDHCPECGYYESECECEEAG